MRKILLHLLLLLPFVAQGQVGGGNTFEFLNLSSSSRATALGGWALAVRDDDVSLAFANPSSLNPSIDGQLSFHYNFLLAGIQNGSVAYGHYLKKADISLYGGVQYVNYGEFEATDVFAQVNGTFKANEYAFTFGGSKEIYERLTLGANVKLVNSSLETYTSWGLATDFAAMFHDTASQWNVSLIFRNVGTQLSTFTLDNNEALPYESQLAISKKLKYLPFRVSIIYRYLNRWNILYDDPNTEETGFLFTEGSETNDGDFVDNLMRHFVFNGEFLFGKQENFRVRLGYNHLRQRELAVNNFRAAGGFTFGVGLKIKRFRIDYGHGIHHFAGSLNHFSISTNLREFTGNRIID